VAPGFRLVPAADPASRPAAVPVTVPRQRGQTGQTLGDVRQRRRGPGAQLRQRRGAADQDDAGDERRDTGGLQRQLPGADLDPVTEDEHAEQDADQGLPRRDGRQRVLQRPGAERALHQPDPDRARAHESVRRPGGEHRGDTVRPEDLQRLPGQRILDAEHEARGRPGQRRPQPAWAAAARLHGGERDHRDRRGGRPVRDRAD
jgi:hypothetical protein